MILLCAFPSPKLRWNETVFVSLLLLLRPLLSLAIFVLCVFYLYPISINKTVICIYIKAFESPFYFWSTATFFAFSLPQRNSNNTWAWFVQKISGCRTYFRLFEHFFSPTVVYLWSTNEHLNKFYYVPVTPAHCSLPLGMKHFYRGHEKV